MIVLNDLQLGVDFLSELGAERHDKDVDDEDAGHDQLCLFAGDSEVGPKVWRDSANHILTPQILK